MVIKLKDCYYDSDFNIETKNSSGVIKFIVRNNNNGNLHYPRYSVTIMTDKDTYEREDIGCLDEFVMDFYISMFLENSVNVELINSVKKSKYASEGTYELAYTKAREALNTGQPIYKDDVLMVKYREALNVMNSNTITMCYF